MHMNFKKNMNKFLALALALILTFSYCVPLFAENTETAPAEQTVSQEDAGTEDSAPDVNTVGTNENESAVSDDSESASDKSVTEVTDLSEENEYSSISEEQPTDESAEASLVSADAGTTEKSTGSEKAASVSNTATTESKSTASEIVPAAVESAQTVPLSGDTGSTTVPNIYISLSTTTASPGDKVVVSVYISGNSLGTGVQTFVNYTTGKIAAKTEKAYTIGSAFGGFTPASQAGNTGKIDGNLNFTGVMGADGDGVQQYFTDGNFFSANYYVNADASGTVTFSFDTDKTELINYDNEPIPCTLGSNVTLTIKNPVTGIQIDSEKTINVNGSFTPALTYTPASTTEKGVTWSSDTPAVATVDANTGLVTGVAPGTANITATSTVNNTIVSNACAVTVKQPPTALTLNPEAKTINVGDTFTPGLTYTPVNTSEDMKGVTWNSNDTSVATVASNGLVTGVGPGTAVITATSTADTSVTSSACTVTVEQLPTALTIPSAQTINTGASFTPTVTYTPANTSADKKGVTWSSDTPAIAKVDAATGLVTGVAPGTAHITAISSVDTSIVSNICTVTVERMPTSISLDPTAKTINVGDTFTPTVSYSPADTSTTKKGVTWTSGTASVATVDAATGLITGVAPGTAVITAKSTADNTLTATCTVTVNQPIKNITLNKTTLALNKGTTDSTLTYSYVPTDTTDTGVSVSSSDPSVATATVAEATKTVTIKALAKGSTVITVASSKDSSKSATCNVTVHVPLESISLDKTVLDLNPGLTGTLTVTYIPSDTDAAKSVTWATSDSSVATVSAEGTVTAGTTYGTATITATSTAFLADGKTHATATCTVNVTERIVPVTGITITSPTQTTVNRGDSLQMTASLTPADTTQTGYTWSITKGGTAAKIDASSGLLTVNKDSTASSGTQIEVTVTSTSNAAIKASRTFTVNVPITGISITPSISSLLKGETQTFTANIIPADTDAADKTIIWSISEGGYATLGATSGSSVTVTGVKAGDVTVTAKAGGVSGNMAFAVKEIPITSVTLDTNSATLEAGKTQTLTATVLPADTTDSKALSWNSSDSSVATVDGNGTVKAVAPGTAVITVSSTVNQAMKDTCTVTVPSHYTALSCTPDSLEMNIGYQKTITAAPTPQTITGSDQIVFESEDPAIATVAADSTGLIGTVTGVTKGTTNIKVYITIGGTEQTSLTKLIPVTVTNHLNSIMVAPASVSLLIGGTKQLTYTYAPDPTDSSTAVTWTSGDETIATVDSTGKVTAVATGTAVITATSEYSSAIKGTCTVTVGENPITGITLNPTTATLEEGATVQINKTLVVKDPSNNTTDDTTIDWTSDNPSVATVDSNGLVTAGTTTGNTTITARSLARPDVAASAEITVIHTLTSISLNKTSTTIHRGSSETLTVSYNPADTTSDKGILWSSADSTVASVDDNGNVTANKVGSAVITATSKADGSPSASCAVTVDSPLTGITINPTSVTVNENGTAAVKFTLEPSDTTELLKNVKIAIDDTAVAVIGGVDSDGSMTVQGLKAGETDLRVSCKDRTDIPAAVCHISVKAPLTGIALNTNAMSLYIGGTNTGKLTVSYQPENTTTAKGVSWKSSDEKVATVDADGNVTANAIGSAKITATTTTGTIGDDGKTYATASCDVTVAQQPVPITGLSIKADPDQDTINRGESAQMTAVPTPSNTTEPGYKWTVEGPATIDQTGKVTATDAAKSGDTITVTVASTVRPEITASKTLTVKVPITSFTITPETASVLKGKTQTFTAAYTPADTDSNTDITWEITKGSEYATLDKTSGATVTTTGVKAGEVTLKATIGGSTGKSAVVTFTVTEIPVTSMTLDKTAASVEPGATLQLNPTLLPTDTTDATTVTWKSSDEKVATVDKDGLVTAVAGGTATITAASTARPDVTAACTVKVPKHLTGIAITNIPASNIVYKMNKINGVDNTADQVSLGLAYTPKDTDDTVTVTWSSSDPTVATVDSKGVVTGIKAGAVTITATAVTGVAGSSALTDSVDLTVVEKTLSNTNCEVVDPSGNIMSGSSNFRMSSGLPQKFTVETDTTDDLTITWASSNTKAATVDADGNVTPTGIGTSTITATVFDKTTNTTVTRTFEVTTTAIPMTEFKVVPDTATITKGSTVQLSITPTPSNATATSVTWSSADTSIATVDANGKVTGVGAGKVAIYATGKVLQSNEEKTVVMAAYITVTDSSSNSGSTSSNSGSSSTSGKSTGGTTTYGTSSKSYTSVSSASSKASTASTTTTTSTNTGDASNILPMLLLFIAALTTIVMILGSRRKEHR